MPELFVAFSVILLISMGVGLMRVIIGPTAPDRRMAAQLLGTSGIGVLVLLAPALEIPALVDVGLIFALLAAVAVAAFTRRRAGQDET